LTRRQIPGLRDRQQAIEPFDCPFKGVCPHRGTQFVALGARATRKLAFVWYLLGQRGDAPTSTLAEAMAVDRSRISKLTSILIELGIVEVAPYRHNQELVYRLTAEGRRWTGGH